MEPWLNASTKELKLFAFLPLMPLGAKSLIDQLFAVHYLDNQDRAWIALDQCFSYRPAAGSFLSYWQEW